MCGIYGYNFKDLEYYYGSQFRFDAVKSKLKDRYNVRPGQDSLVISNTGEAEFMNFGLIPSWATDKKIAFSTINARSETVDEKPTYKKPFLTQRCLVLANFFVEPDKNDPKIKRYYLFKKKDGSAFAMAGIYDINTKIDKDPILSFSILTTSPIDIVAPHHDRSPLILTHDQEKEWLNPDITEADKLKRFLKPYDREDLISYEVPGLIGNWRNDFPEVVKPIV